jgi:uroporphyrinogen decarboxylase
MLTPRERALTALGMEEPDRVPMWEGWITNDPVYNEVVGKTPSSAPQLEENVELQLLCYRRLNLDMSPVVGIGAPRDWKPRRIDERTYVGETGSIHRYSPESEQTFIIGYPVKTPEDARTYTYIDPNSEGRLDHIGAFVKRAQKYDMMTVVEVGGGLEYTIEEVASLQTLSVLMHRYPSLARKLIDMVVDFSIEVGRAVIDMGVEVIEISNDSGFRDGPMISPKLFHEFIAPTLKRQAEVFKKKGASAVIIHCDGNVYRILDDMVDSGADGWHAIEPQAGMDLGLIKERYGDRMCLLGNIDVSHTLPFGTPQSVAREVRERIRAAAYGGGYFLGSSNSIHRGIPPMNVLAMYDAGLRYGKYMP